MQRAQVRIAVFIFNRIDRGMSDAESFGELLLGQIILAPEGFPLARAVCSDIAHDDYLKMRAGLVTGRDLRVAGRIIPRLIRVECLLPAPLHAPRERRRIRLILDNWREPPPLQSLPPFVSAAFQCYETWSIWKPVWVTAACVTGTATEVWKLPS